MDERHAADALVERILTQRAGGEPAPSQKTDEQDVALADAIARLAAATSLDAHFRAQLEARLRAAEPSIAGSSSTVRRKLRVLPLNIEPAPLVAVLATVLLALASFAAFRLAGTWPFANAPTATTNADKRASAMQNIRACLGAKDASVQYLSTARSSSYAADVVADFYRADNYDVQANSASGQVIQIGPSAGAAIPDGGPRRTAEQLQAMALDFIARCAGTDLRALVANHGTKSENSFFRWEDRTRTLEGMYPFVQVGFNPTGQLLSYTNTVDLTSRATREPTRIFTPVPFVQQLVVVPGQPQQLIALVNNFRLARSLNAGKTWNELLKPDSAMTLDGIGIDAHNPQTLYAAGPGGIFRSNDQGILWSLLHWMGGQGITVAPDDPRVLWTASAIGRTAIVLHSTDSGRTWADASAGIAGAMLAGPILIDPTDPNTLFAVFHAERGGQVVYRGTRSGDWMPLPPTGSGGACCGPAVGLAWSSRDRTLYVGSLDGKLYMTTGAVEPNAAGITWKVMADRGPHVRVNVLAYDNTSDTLYISTSDADTHQSKLLVSDDGGATWRELTVP
jgi:photosystem II stability/assembly factor-like uncharacterized protein